MRGHRWRRGDGMSLGAIALGATLGLAWTGGIPGHAPPSADRTESVEAPATEAPRPSSSQQPLDAGFAFAASSLGHGWAVDGDYGGRVRWSEDDLRLEVATALLRFDGAAALPQRLVGIRLALAEPTSDGGWRVVRAGPLHPLPARIRPGGAHWTGPLALSLPDARGSVEEDRWLVIVHEVDTVADGEVTRGTTYVHLDPAVLHRLMGWDVDGC